MDGANTLNLDDLAVVVEHSGARVVDRSHRFRTAVATAWLQVEVKDGTYRAAVHRLTGEPRTLVKGICLQVHVQTHDGSAGAERLTLTLHGERVQKRSVPIDRGGAAAALEDLAIKNSRRPALARAIDLVRTCPEMCARVERMRVEARVQFDRSRPVSEAAQLRAVLRSERPEVDGLAGGPLLNVWVEERRYARMVGAERRARRLDRLMNDLRRVADRHGVNVVDLLEDG